MAFNTQVSLSPHERAKGSLSDILPDLQDLIDVREKSSGAAEQASTLHQLRHLLKRSGATALPENAVRNHEMSRGMSSAAALASGGMWGPFSSLNLQGAATSQSGTGHREDALGGVRNLADVVPYANILQTQAGLLGAGKHELCQRLLEGSSDRHQQQQLLWSQAAQHSAHSQGPLVLCSTPEASEGSQSRGLYAAMIRPPPAPRGGASPQRRGSKRRAEGKLLRSRSAVTVDEEESEPSCSELSAKPQDTEKKRRLETSNANLRSGGRCNKSQRQQEQNKQAQQRYRERRKLKVVEMEAQLSEAQQQIVELQGVFKQNVALQDKVLTLEAQLAEKGRECQQLEAIAGNASRVRHEGGPSREELGMDIQDHYLRLEATVEKHGLRAGTIHDAERRMGGRVLDLLKGTVAACRELCHQMQRSNPGPAAEEAGRDWPHQELCLDKGQVQELLAAHNAHLRQLQALHDSRRLLLSKAISRPNPMEGGSKQLGHAELAQYSAALWKDMSTLEEGFAQEERLVEEHSVAVVEQTLSPGQATLLLLSARPAGCDCLAFTAAVAASHAGAASDD